MASLGGENRLTEMELLSVKHALDSEVLGLKKCLHYAQEVGDEQARHLFREHADIHHRRIDMMLTLLDAPGDITKHAKMLMQLSRPQGGEQHA
jgi:hypothetical protein